MVMLLPPGRMMRSVAPEEVQDATFTITNPGGATMQVRNFTFTGGLGMQDLGSSGANHRFQVNSPTGDFTVYAGATLEVGANQAPGIYTGTFSIHLQYD